MSNSEQHKPLILSSPNHGSRQQPHFLFVVIFVAILAFGTLGYHIIEDWSPFDAFYMTVITLATIGYGETHPLTTEGRVFTVVLIFVGLTLGTFVLGAAWHAIAEAQFNRIFDRRRKMLDKIQKLHGHTIFCGYSRLGKQAALELRAAAEEVVIIESNEVRANDAEAAGLFVVRGDATTEEALSAAGINRARRIISLLPRDSDNLYVILSARESAQSIHIITRAEDEVGEKRLRRAGADQLVSTYSLAARKLADGIMRPQITEFFEVAGTGKDGWKIEEIRIPPSSPVCGQTLKQLSLRQTAKVGIAAVVSPTGELEINPDGATPLLSGSTLIAIGWKEDLKVLEKSVLAGP